MGERSKIESLPADTRAELDRRLFEGRFSGYVELEAWLRKQGFEVGKSSIHRYGSRLEERMAQIQRSTEQAKALVAASPDDAGDMGEALMRLMSEKLFTLLMEMDVDPESADLGKIAKALAPLMQAQIKQKKYASEVRDRARTAADAAEKIGRTGGLSAESAAELRRAILGIAA